MPQENGWATGPEHTANDGRVCPYCGSENTDSGSLDTQAGQVVESGCTCLDCNRSWSNLYNIAGWYDDVDETLHEDLEQYQKAEKCEEAEATAEALKKKIGTLREALEKTLGAITGRMGPTAIAAIKTILMESHAALEAAKGEA